MSDATIFKVGDAVQLVPERCTADTPLGASAQSSGEAPLVLGQTYVVGAIYQCKSSVAHHPQMLFFDEIPARQRWSDILDPDKKGRAGFSGWWFRLVV